MEKYPIRVLEVLGGLNPGGAETMIMNYYRNIDRSKIQLDFIIHNKEEQFYEKEILNMGGKIYRFPKYKVYNHFRYKKVWNDFLKEHSEYKVVHGHMRSIASIYLKIAKKFRLTTISHSHSMDNGVGLKAIVKNFLCKKINKYSDYCFACSDEAAVWLFGEKIINSDKYILLKNALDISKYKYDDTTRKKVRNQLNLHNEFVIGHIGRFCIQKNHQFLLDIFKKLKMINNKKYKLLLIGTGELKNKVIEESKKYGIYNDIIFLENRNDINELLQAMDAFCFPSIHEGLGIAAIEAQASGLMTIISDKVPSSVIITPNILQLPLIKEKWIDAVKNITTYDRKIETNLVELKNAGYDIKTEAKKLEKLYIKLSLK